MARPSYETFRYDQTEFPFESGNEQRTITSEGGLSLTRRLGAASVCESKVSLLMLKKRKRGKGVYIREVGKPGSQNLCKLGNWFLTGSDAPHLTACNSKYCQVKTTKYA
jgi:hypothetical protein